MPEDAIIRRERCRAITKRRGLNRRCKHTTLHGIYCHQHQRTERGLRITKSELPGAGDGVFTTKPIPKGAIVCYYTGDEVVEKDPEYSNLYALQIKKRPPTFIVADETNEPGEGRWVNDGRDIVPNNSAMIYNKKTDTAYIKAKRDIEPGEEILVDYGEEYPWREPTKPKKVVPERKPFVHQPKKKLIKPIQPPEPEDWPIPNPDLEPQVKAKRVQRSPQEKHEIFHLKRLVALQHLWNDEKLAHSLKIPPVKRVINVPKKKKGELFNYALEKLLKKERGLWVKHVNQNPRNNMTEARAHAIIEKSV